MVSVPACIFYPCDRQASSLHIEFFHTDVSFCTSYIYPKICPVVYVYVC